jgi:anti-anti-sigma regulatory factor
MNKRLNIKINSEIDIENLGDIDVDFSSIDNIALQDIKKIAEIHKVAVLNGKKLYIKNAAPEVMNLLAMTGLHKSFSNFDETSIKLDKRQRGL